MKKRIGYKKLICMLMMAMVLSLSLTACGKDSSDDDKKEKKEKKQTVAEVKEEDDKDADEETEPVPEGILEVVPESTPEPTAEPIPEQTTGSAWEVIEEVTPAPTAIPDVVNKYEGYFKRYGSIIKENVEIKVRGEYKGRDIEMRYAYNDNYRYMDILVGSCDLNMIGSVDILCLSSDYDECGQGFANIDIDNIEQLDSLFIVDEFLTLAEGITNETYKESDTDDGIRYDIITGTVKDLNTDTWRDVRCKINCETQKLEGMTIFYEDDESIMFSFEHMSEDAMNQEMEERIGWYTKHEKMLKSLDVIQEIYNAFFEHKAEKEIFGHILK